VSGPQGVGKTSMFATEPNCIVLDFDSASEFHPLAKCERIRLKGLSAKDAMKRIHEAVGIAEKYGGKGVDTFVIDTGDAWYGLSNSKVIQDAQEKWPEKNITALDDVPAKFPVSLVYGEMWPIIHRLRNANCSLVISTYLRMNEEQYVDSEGKSQKRLVEAMTLPPKFLSDILGMVDFSVAVRKEVHKTPRFQETKVPGGQSLRVQAGTDVVEKRFLHFKEEDAVKGSIHKAGMRVPMPPKVELLSLPDNPAVSSPDNWPTIRKLYEQGIADLRSKFNL
jgi:hypothetical protein